MGCSAVPSESVTTAGPPGRWAVLSDDEQRAWAEIEGSLTAAPPGERHRVARALTWLGVGLSALLLLGGVPSAAVAVGLATALVRASWRWWRRTAGPPDLLLDRDRARARLHRFGSAVGSTSPAWRRPSGAGRPEPRPARGGGDGAVTAPAGGQPRRTSPKRAQLSSIAAWAAGEMVPMSKNPWIMPS